jgi:hypothetical protein
MFIATVVLSGILAVVFGAGAVGKVTRMRSQVETAAKLGIRWRRYRLIALPEAAAAVGLLAGLGFAGLGVASAIGLVALMAGAVVFRVKARDGLGFVLGDATLMVFAIVTAVLRSVTA